MKIPFGTNSYKHNDRPISSQECINLYPEIQPPDTQTNVALLPVPGLELLASLGTGPIRAIHRFNDLYYVISGTTLYSVNDSGTYKNLGSISGTAFKIIDNGFELFIPLGTTAYTYDTTNGLVEVTDTDFLGAADSCFQDGYVINVVPNSRSFQISALQDATSYAALDYASAEGSVGNLVGCISDHRELWLFKTDAIEVWYNSGDPTFPFERTTFLETGCYDKGSIQKLDNSVFWLGHDLNIYRVNGYQPIRISTHAIEQTIEGYSNKSCTSYIQEWEGHKFYVISFAEGTWAYDVSTQAWHQRKSYNKERSRISCLYGNVCGDYENGNLYSVTNAKTENGNPIQRQVTSPFIGATESRSRMSKVQIQFDQGQGLTSGQGSDPTVLLSWSDDGGYTWSNNVSQTLGQKGRYGYRTTFYRLGSFYRRCYRILISDPVNVAILGAYGE